MNCIVILWMYKQKRTKHKTLWCILNYYPIYAWVFQVVRDYILIWLIFYGEKLTPRPNSKLRNHPFSAADDCLFNTFAATLTSAGRFSTRNLRTRHAVVTGTHLSWASTKLQV
jgi:hypothetical protein